MKVLFDHPWPFSLAHGGFQVQIEQSKAGLERRGIEVEYLRWWDDRQSGDLIHYFGPPSPNYLAMAKTKGLPVAVTHLFTATCNRSLSQLKVQGLVTRTLLRLPGWGMIKNQLNWQGFQRADRLIVGLRAERQVLEIVFGISPEKVSLVPLGLHDDFLKAGAGSRSEPYLVTTGTITERKRSVELARMAIEARVPILFIGKPYSLNDPYWKQFSALIDGRFVLHRDHVAGREEMISLLQAARGFVIFSLYENWCLSAHEAAACGLPVLLPDQPWSRECFGTAASYLDARGGSDNPARLSAFYQACPQLPAPGIKLYSWDEVAGQLEAAYQLLIKR